MSQKIDSIRAKQISSEITEFHQSLLAKYDNKIRFISVVVADVEQLTQTLTNECPVCFVTEIMLDMLKRGIKHNDAVLDKNYVINDSRTRH